MALTRSLPDTAAYSAFLRGHRDVQRALQRVDRIVLTPVVLGELRAGFVRGGRRAKHEAELARFRESPRVDVVDMDEGTADRYAAIVEGLRGAGTPIPTNDVWIAASAMQHGLRLITTDAHFRHIAQVIVDFFDPVSGG